jgi:hypothetical protein
MSLRELMIEYILFAFSIEELATKFSLTEEELVGLADIDLLEIYDTTLMCNPS